MSAKAEAIFRGAENSGKRSGGLPAGHRGGGGFFYPIHQTGADLLNEAKASLTDKNPILVHEKRRRGGGGCRKWEIWKEEWKRAGP